METKKEKRKREEGRDSLEAVNPFAKSKKVGRSPSKIETSTEDMGEMKEMKDMLKKIMEDTNQISEIKREVENLKIAMSVKENEWKREKEEITNAVREMERKIEETDKKERKKNVVITGLDAKEMKEKNVEEWIEKELGVKVEVEEVYGINQGKKMVVKIRRWEEKRKIMASKKKLRDKVGSKVFIDDDLTKRERETQKEIREKANEERRKGNQVKVGYKKIWMNGQWYRWGETKEDNSEKKN